MKGKNTTKVTKQITFGEKRKNGIWWGRTISEDQENASKGQTEKVEDIIILEEKGRQIKLKKNDKEDKGKDKDEKKHKKKDGLEENKWENPEDQRWSRKKKQRNNEDSKRALLRPSILTLESKKDQRKEKKESFDKGRSKVMHSRKVP